MRAQLKQARAFLAKENFLYSLILTCLVSISLLSARIIVSDSLRFVFLYWNLALAVLPVILSYWLVKRIRLYGWFKWPQIILTAIWLIFLPNSFYLVTDMVHLRANFEASFYFDVIMLTSFMLSGLALGFYSVYVVHKELKRFFSPRFTMAIIGLVYLMCSFAAYLGRFTRWNSWDILLQPFGLLFDVSDRFVNPSVHDDTYLVTFSLFIVLFSSYYVVWTAVSKTKTG